VEVAGFQAFGEGTEDDEFELCGCSGNFRVVSEVLVKNV
jgi:hypothetical protein